MARIKYYYDTETCRYERIKTSKLDVFINSLGILFLIMVFAAVFAGAYVHYFPSEKEVALMKDNEELLFYYEEQNQKIDYLQGWLTKLQKRDDEIYRVIYEVEPISESVRAASIGGRPLYDSIFNLDMDHEELILKTVSKVDRMKRQLYVQSKSYDELEKLAIDKNQMLASIPAIQPVHNKDLKRFASGFGMRMHPIYKVWKMHQGVDFSAPTGTPIFASGDGKIIRVERKGGRRGYGHQVEIDHGYNYITKYAHMSKIDVRVGQKVKRGEKIGEVGNTGGSVAPHLHYEVIYKGKKVNPVYYFYSDLSPEMFDEIIKQATIENQMFDGM